MREKRLIIMKNILITGISGFIGRYLYLFCPKDVYLSGTFYQNKPEFKNIKLYRLALSEIERFISIAPKFDTVIHCAAEADLSVCEKNPEYAFSVNENAIYQLARWSAEQDSRFIYLSTDIVFHGDKGDYTESDIPDPINIYGKSKFAGENVVLETHSNAVVARIALCLGKGLGGTKSFIDFMIDKIRKNEQIPLFYDEIRTPVSAIYVAKAIWELVENRFKGIIHLTGNEKLNRYEFGKEFVKYFPQYNPQKLIKTSLTKAGYPRPVDVSMKSQLADKILNTKSEKITHVIENLI